MQYTHDAICVKCRAKLDELFDIGTVADRGGPKGWTANRLAAERTRRMNINRRPISLRLVILNVRVCATNDTIAVFGCARPDTTMYIL